MNFMKEPLHVKHSELQRYDQSEYRSKCPVCATGVLLVRRDSLSFQLVATDLCIRCGQRVIYDDIEELRKLEPYNIQEADMTISGTVLTPAQSMTVRVAIQTFALHCQHVLKGDPSGSNIEKGYLARINDLNELIMLTAR